MVSWFPTAAIPNGVVIRHPICALYQTTVLNQHTGFHHQEQGGGKSPTPLILNKKLMSILDISLYKEKTKCTANEDKQTWGRKSRPQLYVIEIAFEWDGVQNGPP